MPSCKGCGRRVIYARDEKGTLQVLDVSAPVYLLHRLNLGDEQEPAVVERAPAAYVSHFATCPKADQFSKGRKP